MIDIDEINERSKNDRAIIVGSEVRELVMMIRQQRAQIERLCDAAEKFWYHGHSSYDCSKKLIDEIAAARKVK